MKKETDSKKSIWGILSKEQSLSPAEQAYLRAVEEKSGQPLGALMLDMTLLEIINSRPREHHYLDNILPINEIKRKKSEA